MTYKLPWIALATLLLVSGIAFGVWLSEKPPLDWQKWSVFGTWFSAIMTALVAMIATWLGVTMPRRFAHAAKVEKFGPMADEIVVELTNNFSHLTTLKNWSVGTKCQFMPTGVLMTDARKRFLDHLKVDHPYAGQIVKDAYDNLQAALSAFEMSDGAGGRIRVVERKDVKKEVVSIRYPEADEAVQNALEMLKQTYSY